MRKVATDSEVWNMHPQLRQAVEIELVGVVVHEKLSPPLSLHLVVDGGCAILGVIL